MVKYTEEDASEKLTFSSISLSEVLRNELRLESSLYNNEAHKYRQLINDGKWETMKLISHSGNQGFTTNAGYPGRFKRDYISPSHKDAIGFIGSSEMLGIDPKPQKFLSKQTSAMTKCKVDLNTLLLSRSGTIGRTALVRNQLKNFLISEHSIRLLPNEYPGYIYTFLITEVGKKLVTTNTYGAVVDQVEPEHLFNIEVPNPDERLKRKIDSMIIESYDLRDSSNTKLEEAESLLLKALKLPYNPMELIERRNNSGIEFKHFDIKLSQHSERLDASYHLPIIESILNKIGENSESMVQLGDDTITSEIILPSRFKRVFVGKNFGTRLIGGKNVGELIPSNEKYLSNKIHENKIREELGIRENAIVITARGTIGKTMLAPKHFEEWAISDNLMQLVPTSEDIAGYLYIFLNSPYGYELITRNTYGGVVDALEVEHINKIPIPFLDNENTIAKINGLALEAKDERFRAYQLEMEAVETFNKEVLGMM